MALDAGLQILAGLDHILGKGTAFDQGHITLDLHRGNALFRQAQDMGAVRDGLDKFAPGLGSKGFERVGLHLGSRMLLNIRIAGFTTQHGDTADE